MMVNLDSTGRRPGGTGGSQGEFAWAQPEAGHGPCRVGEGGGGSWLSTGASRAERERGRRAVLGELGRGRGTGKRFGGKIRSRVARGNRVEKFLGGVECDGKCGRLACLRGFLA